MPIDPRPHVTVIQAIRETEVKQQQHDFWVPFGVILFYFLFVCLLIVRSVCLTYLFSVHNT